MADACGHRYTNLFLFIVQNNLRYIHVNFNSQRVQVHLNINLPAGVHVSLHLADIVMSAACACA